MARGTIYQRPRVAAKPNETVVTSTCGHNCGGRCVVNAHVRGRPHREDLHRPAEVDVRAAAAPRLRPRLRPGRARLPSRPPEAAAAPDRTARLGPVRADLVGRRARRGGARDAAHPGRVRQRRHPRRLPLGQPVHAPRPRRGPALPLHVRRLHGAVVEHVGGGGDLRGAHDLRRQGGVQERRARAHRLPQLEADRDVGLEPGRRDVRHEHLAVPQVGQEAGRADRLRRPAPDPVEPRSGRRARLHPAVHRRRRADRDGVRDRAARACTTRPTATATCWASTRITCRPARRRGARTAPTCSASPTACGRRPSGRPRSPACRRRRSGGSPWSSPRRSRRRSSAATRRGARPTASSSTAPPTRSPPSPATWASRAATRARATAPPDAPASRACPRAPTPSTRACPRRCSPTSWRAARRAATPPTSR